MAHQEMLGRMIGKLSLLAVLLAGCGVAPETPNDFPLPPTPAPETPTGVGQKSKVEFIWATASDVTPLKAPSSLTVDGEGNTYVVDTGTYSIRKLDWQGQPVAKWGSKGKGDGQFLFTFAGIALDQHGNTYVTDDVNARIQKFDSSGHFLLKWGKRGSGDGQFNYPGSVGVDGQGNIYVFDFGNYRIQKFNPDGEFL